MGGRGAGRGGRQSQRAALAASPEREAQRHTGHPHHHRPRGHVGAIAGGARYTASAFIHREILLAMTAATAPDTLTDAEYHARIAAALASVEAAADRWLQDDVVDIDTQRTGGLLELSFPNGSKIVLNAQPPLHELWMAARSGGFHYKFVGGRWLDTRDAREFFEALSACASEQAGVALRFELSA
jgi:CyaY protein